jgi:XTP/dITP diphosphohydrolase
LGYAAVFVADATSDGRTSAELSPADKDAISHRGRALRKMAPLVVGALQDRA